MSGSIFHWLGDRLRTILSLALLTDCRKTKHTLAPRFLQKPERALICLGVIDTYVSERVSYGFGNHRFVSRSGGSTSVRFRGATYGIHVTVNGCPVQIRCSVAEGTAGGERGPNWYKSPKGHPCSLDAFSPSFSYPFCFFVFFSLSPVFVSPSSRVIETNDGGVRTNWCATNLPCRFVLPRAPSAAVKGGCRQAWPTSALRLGCRTLGVVCWEVEKPTPVCVWDACRRPLISRS